MITKERKEVLRARALANHTLMPAYVVPGHWRLCQAFFVGLGTVGAVIIESWIAASDPHIDGTGPFATEVPTHSFWSIGWALVFAIIFIGQACLTEWVNREPDQAKVNRVLNWLWALSAAWGARNAIEHHRYNQSVRQQPSSVSMTGQSTQGFAPEPPDLFTWKMSLDGASKATINQLSPDQQAAVYRQAVLGIPMPVLPAGTFTR